MCHQNIIKYFVNLVNKEFRYNSLYYIYKCELFFMCSIVGNSSRSSLILCALIFVARGEVSFCFSLLFNMKKVAVQSIPSCLRYFVFLCKFIQFSKPLSSDSCVIKRHNLTSTRLLFHNGKYIIEET